MTICAVRRLCLFGCVVDAEVQLSAAGDLVAQEWLRSAELRSGVVLDAFVVMPNHLHGIIVIDGSPVSAAAIRQGRAGPNVLPTIVNGFKATTTRRIRELRRDPKLSVWQRNYYEHIRSERSLDRIREYIASNPANWAQDRENPDAVGRRARR